MAQDNKTERATPRRRQKAREKGQVVRSRELVAGLATMAAALLFSWQLASFPALWRVLFRRTLDSALAGDAGARGLMVPWSLNVFRGVAITLALTWMVAGLAALAQGGLVFAPASLAPTWSRLSPTSRLEQLFSIISLSRLLKSLIPTAALVYLAVSMLARDWH